MNNYLQQIALRSGGVEWGNNSGSLQMTPVANSFLEDRLIEKEPHQGWDEVFETKESKQAFAHAHTKQTVIPSSAQDQQLNPVATNAEMPQTYLKAQLQRRLAAAQIPPFQPTQLAASTVEPTTATNTSGGKQNMPIEPLHPLQRLEKERKERAADLEKQLQPVTGALFNKANREQSMRTILQPNAPVPLPAVPKTKKVENKLVIGRITVEVMKPAVQTKERVVIRTYEPSPRTHHQERNKLSFGLGQL
jgi:hypothetical protein